jgi:predicted ATPase
MEQLQRALEHAKAGQGQIVGTMGEPGLGKSRLFYEFVGARRAVPLLVHGCLVLEAYSVSHGKASPYLPVIELLKNYFRIEPHDDERTRREKIIGKVLGLDRSLEETLPYLFALLGIEEQPSPLQQMDAQIRRRRTFEALKKLFLRESLNQPLVLIFEDLHWIDGETQGFLDVLSESVASAKLLLLTNYRPEYRHEWGQKTYYTQLRLAPFGKEEAEEFLDVLLGEAQFPLPVGERARVRGMENNLHALKQLILEKTQGTPFFMEEIVQELREQGVLVRGLADVGAALRGRPQEGTHIGVPLQGLHIPPTVQSVLAARIDRLAPDEKALLQQLAVVGRQFPLSLVRQVITQPEAELYRLLDALQRKEFLYERPAFPEVEYLFKHALTQEVAYGTVLHERRKVLHEQTAVALETLYSANLEEHYSELAHHYSRSGNTAKAIQYLGSAGQQAIQRSAYTEATSQLTLALDLLKTRPETLERAQQELMLQIALGMSLLATIYAVPEVERVYTRARELCQQLGDFPQLCRVLRGLWLFYMSRAENKIASDIAEQFLDMAQQLQDPIFLVGAHEGIGFSLFLSAKWIAALEHYEQSIALYDPRKHSTHLSLYEADLGVWSFAQAAPVLWCLGYPEQALHKSREALRFAQQQAHPFTLNWALGCVAWLHQCRQEPQETQRWAEAVLALAHEQGFQMWSVWGTSLHG